MADSNYGTPLHYHYHMQNQPVPQPQGQDTTAHPLYSPFAQYNSYLSYETGGFNSFAPSHPNTQMPDPVHGQDPPFGYITQGRVPHYHQFAHAAHHTGGYIPPPAASMYPHGHNQPPASGPYHNLQMPGSQRPDLPETLSNLEMPHILAHPNGGMYFSGPSYPHPPMSGFALMSGRRADQMLPTPSTPPASRFDGDSMPSTPQNRGSSRGATDLLDQPRHLTSTNRRPSYDRQAQHSLQLPGVSDRRPSHTFATHSRRSDRSVSPRISNRRPFDRYAADLQNPNGPSEFSQAAARNRRTRPRTIPPRAHFVDGNTPTANQMQELRDKLRHFLPSELPKDSSPTCDICQKDYSTKHVQPSEEEEVAIQLPCKHVFGEHCINTWFETCKTHKNKITCPMCRELLIKPMPRLTSGLGGLTPETLTFIRNTMDAGGFSGRGEHQLIAQLARVRELDGDFPHF